MNAKYSDNPVEDAQREINRKNNEIDDLLADFDNCAVCLDLFEKGKLQGVKIGNCNLVVCDYCKTQLNS